MYKIGHGVCFFSIVERNIMGVLLVCSQSQISGMNNYYKLTTGAVV